MEFSALRQYGVTPILRSIDRYQANQNNAHLLEFRVGQGRALVASLNIQSHLREKREAQCLLQSMIDYAQGPNFQPSAEVPKEEFLRWFSPSPPTSE